MPRPRCVRVALTAWGGDGGTEVRQGVVALWRPDLTRRHSYGAAAPLVAEWRRLYGGGVDEGDRVERAMAEERMRGLEIELIEDHGLTLPPAPYPWTEGERRSEVRSRRMTLEQGPRRTHPGRVAAAAPAMVDPREMALTLGEVWRTRAIDPGGWGP